MPVATTTFSTIQFLRFIAAFLVLIYHLGMMNSGYKGVDIFFVISGFVMCLKLFSSNRPRPFIFFVNRVTKIFFLYWIVLISFYIIRPFAVKDLLISLFLVPGHTFVLAVAWTLKYELCFYFLIGIIAYLLPGRHFNAIVLFFLLTSAIVSALLLFAQFTVIGTAFLIVKSTGEFFLGVAGALWFVNSLRAVKPGILLSVIFLSLVLLLVINITTGLASMASVIYGILSVILISCMAAYEKKVPVHKIIAIPFNILGAASYGIYLLAPVVTVLVPGTNTFSKATVIIVTIVIAVLLNRVVEINGLIWCRKIIYKLRPATWQQ